MSTPVDEFNSQFFHAGVSKQLRKNIIDSGLAEDFITTRTLNLKDRNKPEYTPEFFHPAELVSEDVYELLGDQAVLAAFDPNILRWADYLRENYGPAYCNTWWLYGAPFEEIFTSSGLRAHDDEYYWEESAHSVWKALDLKFVRYSAEYILQDLMHKQSSGQVIPYVRRIEKTYQGKPCTWIHGDTLDSPPGNLDVYFFDA